jgi:superfamily I DNA/RNA helicase
MNLIANPDAYHLLCKKSVSWKNKFFQHVLIDEAQDLSISQIKFFGALADNQPNALFLAGDVGQQIFQQPFAWSTLGVNIKGRSRQLRVNYRTSHQIRSTADLLLPDSISDGDGNSESRNNTISVFNGPDPKIKLFEDKQAEIDWVADKLNALVSDGIHLEELGLFVRSEKQFSAARAALKNAGIAWSELERTNTPQPNRVSLSSMHLAKGLEFRVVIVMSCDDEVVPLSSRIESVTDEATLEDIYSTERHLLYVACTRAREQLYLTATEPESEFLLDII